jgi:nitrite reductase/ring-hydroxylating ferredoxin subunit
MDAKTNTNQAACPTTAREPEHPKLSRRSFLKAGVGALGALALLEIGGAGLLYLQAGSLDGEFGGVVTAGLIDDFPPGSVTEFTNSHFFLIRSPDGGFLAVHNRCTHLGCTVSWEPAENRFFCPCHAASFDFYGDYQNPPVPRPLDTFRVIFDESLVRVDTAEPRRRETFEPRQLVYAPGDQQIERSSRENEGVAGPSEG